MSFVLAIILVATPVTGAVGMSHATNDTANAGHAAADMHHESAGDASAGRTIHPAAHRHDAGTAGSVDESCKGCESGLCTCQSCPFSPFALTESTFDPPSFQRGASVFAYAGLQPAGSFSPPFRPPITP